MKHASVSEFVDKVQTWDPRKQGAGTTLRYIDIGSVSQIEKVIENPPTIQAEEAPSRARQIVKAGDILISTVRPNLNAVALVPDELDGATASTGFSILRPDNAHLTRNYLFHWVRTQAFISEMMRQATGQSYPAVSDKIVKASKIPLPPLEEQRRIAGILDQADALRRLRNRALDKLNTLGQAIFHEMFGDISRNCKNLPQLSLTDALTFKTGKLDSNAAVEGGRYPFFTCAKEASTIDKFAFDGEALLLAGNNANADYDVKYYKGKFNAYQRTYVLTLKSENLTYQYVQRALETMLGEMKRFSKGSNTKYLTMEIFRRMQLCIPDLQLQLLYAERAKALAREKLVADAASSEAQTLFCSLQHSAFRGQL
ncbi:MAG: restriction endonuclease subunit S [Pseudomonadota bacterium]